MKAGSLSSVDLQGLLNASYDKKIRNVNGFQQDRELSTKTSKVYVDPTTGQAVVAHKGTSGNNLYETGRDWLNNAAYAIGGNKLYKTTSRFKEAESVQRNAEAKYGKQNISTIGHSQGGLQAELLGKRGHETITLNKAARPFTNRPSANQFDIQTQGDLVSAFSHPTDIISANLNPLAAHSVDTLALSNRMYGGKLCVGGENSLSDLQIDRMLPMRAFHGCFTKDELPALRQGFYCVNLNGQSHWCGLMVANEGCTWFDAFGFPAPTEVEKKIGSYSWNDSDIQDLHSSACGYYVVAFIKWMHSGKSFVDFCSLFSKRTKENEAILKTLCH